MKKVLPRVLAFCVILALAAFPIMASNSYYEYPYSDYYGYSYEEIDAFWLTPDNLANRTNVYITGNFAETYYREYHRPVFGASAGPGSSVNGTLVSHANFAGSWSAPNQTFPIGDGVRGGFYARPNGNANNMHNGFTFIEISVADLAANPDGVNVTIAFSNQSGGNTPNAAWNTPVLGGNYSYNVRITDGQVVVAVNGFMSGSWGATMTSNLANWGNNPNSNIRHQRNASVNLGSASGTVFVFFHGQNLTFYGSNNSDTIVGCELYRLEPAYRAAYAGYVCHRVVLLNQYGHEIYNGGFGSKVIPLPDEIAVGLHHFTAKLVVNNVTIGTYPIVVEVVRVTDELRVATAVDGNTIDFGRVIAGNAPNIIICDWCQ